ncbi:GLUG motif-containing protein, partial [Floccifex sp.]|uniref:GLUG motif-containing protein n=1 Tax=Floccifex sp. TaxID=2815810 RepID=UPI003F1146A2
MKHKIRQFFVFLFMIPLILLSSVSVYAMEEKVYINNVSDFVEMSKQCTLDTYSKNKTFILTKDISLKNYENFSIPVFSGEFDGNGHTIRDFTIKKNQNPCGLFAIVQQTGIVKNVKVTASIEVSSENTGAIAGENYGTIENCSVSGSICGKQNTGGIAGINTVSGIIKNCRMNGTVIGTKMTGGISGSSLGIIQSCQNQAYVNTTSNEFKINIEDLDFSFNLSKISTFDTSSYYDTGGITGYLSGIVSNCTNTAPVGYLHIGYNVGGIAGRSCGFITDCTNTASISGRKDVGGICGQMEPYIAKSINKSTLGQLQDQLKELDSLLTQILNDTQNESSILISRCNQLADYMDQAANAANNIETTGSISGLLSGSSQSSANGNVTMDPGNAEIEKDASISKDSTTILIPGVEINQGTVSSEKDVEMNLEQGSVDSSANASHFGEIDASSQLSITTNLSGLSSSISGMAGVLRLLNNEIGNSSVTLSNDLKAIQNKINEISNTYLQLFDNPDNEYIQDVSQEDIESISLGKISQTTNEGNIQGDLNAGGIIGSMAIEYELDP